VSSSRPRPHPTTPSPYTSSRKLLPSPVN
jgi:hypothetical protein